MRLLIIGTHPFQTTGYSKVVYNICKCFDKYKDINVTVFGIQKFTVDNDVNRNNLPINVNVWDVYKNDKEDFGFGTSSLKNFILINQPDIVLVYNDANVVQKYIMNLMLIPDRKFKIVVYLDQLYTYQDQDCINYIAQNSDHIFCFTDFWRNNLFNTLRQEQKLFNKISPNSSIIKHGIDTRLKIADTNQSKLLINFVPNDFLFLNLNRIQGRKRPDIAIHAFALFLKKSRAQNAFMVFPNTRDNKLDLLKIFKHILREHNLDQTLIHKLRLFPSTNFLNDDQINIIYNACDVGINTCEAEGFGLCNYEHASLGKPQIVSNVGGLRDFFNSENSIVCDPKITVYSDNGGDILGNATIVDAKDVAEAMLTYYTDKNKREVHGNKCLEIKQKYVWQNETDNMVQILKKII
jgi:glycosyltransferase involved in cell wall biosynthesis